MVLGSGRILNAQGRRRWRTSQRGSWAGGSIGLLEKKSGADPIESNNVVIPMGGNRTIDKIRITDWRSWLSKIYPGTQINSIVCRSRGALTVIVVSGAIESIVQDILQRKFDTGSRPERRST